MFESGRQMPGDSSRPACSHVAQHHDSRLSRDTALPLTGQSLMSVRASVTSFLITRSSSAAAAADAVASVDDIMEISSPIAVVSILVSPWWSTKVDNFYFWPRSRCVWKQYVFRLSVRVCARKCPQCTTCTYVRPCVLGLSPTGIP